MSEPVWKRPAWITAIVGVISAFLTVPGIVGEYLAKEQDIEAARLSNIALKQDQEFKIVNDTLAHLGPERIFVLRYLAATLDDPEARAWALEEVGRLDELTRIEEELGASERKLAASEAKLKGLRRAGEKDTRGLEEKIDELEAELAQRDAALSYAQSQAGIAVEPRFVLSVLASVDPGAVEGELTIETDSRVFPCAEGPICQITFRGSIPRKVEVYPSAKRAQVSVSVVGQSGGGSLTYLCSYDPQDRRTTCAKVDERAAGAAQVLRQTLNEAERRETVLRLLQD